MHRLKHVSCLFHVHRIHLYRVHANLADFNLRRLGLTVALAVATLQCGHRVSSSHAEGSADARSTSAHPETGEGGKPVSLDPHPASCGTCDTAETTPIAACPHTVGQAAPCEGRCFVAQSIQPRWNNEPPSSGPMYGYPDWKWNEHTTAVPRGSWVHNLAHGFVVFLYNCPQGCDKELSQLRDILQARAGSRLLMTPDPLLTGSRFAAVAWTWAYLFDTPSKADILCFIDQHVAHGSEG